jgi:hypothetical protein
MFCAQCPEINIVYLFILFDLFLAASRMGTVNAMCANQPDYKLLGLVKSLKNFYFIILSIDILRKVCCVPATSTAFSKGIIAAATNSTNQRNKAGSACH